MAKKIVRRALPVLLLCASIADNSGAQQNSETNDAAKMQAAELARTQLTKQLQIDAIGIEAISTEAHTWSDSSLGCGRAGMQAAQVVSPGYEVILKTPRGNYRVHTANGHAIVCGAATEWRKRPNVGLPLKNLNGKIDEARADLAKKLAAPLNEIRTVAFTQTEWADSSMDCAVAGEQIDKQSTKGYRIALSYVERVYTYHTDLNRVRACPAIEAD